MTNLTNARKVYQTPELISTVLGFLNPVDYWRVYSLERSFLSLAVGVIWRDVSYEVAQAALKGDSPRAQLYIESIRGITLTDSSLPKDEKSQLRGIKSLIDNFPNLLKARRIISSRLGSRKYDWSIHREVDGVFEVDIISQMVLRGPPRSRRSGRHGVDHWRMRIDRGMEVVIDIRKAEDASEELMIQRFARGTINDQLKNKLVAYLLNTAKRDPDICGIVIEDLQMDIRELTRICTSINAQGRLKEIVCKNLRTFEYEELEHFCIRYFNSQSGLDEGEGETRSGGLEVLVLDHIIPICQLRLTHIDRIIQLINEHFPNLWYLEIPITILQPLPPAAGQHNTGNGNGFVNVNEIRIPDQGLNRMKNLEKVVINVFGNVYRGLDLRFPFPIEDVAQNLAALNAPESCRYEIRNRTSVFLGMDVSRKLNREVHKYQRLAPDGLIAFHAHDNPPSYDSIS